MDKQRFKKGRYAGNKWGGKYLRAPDIFYTILEKGKGKFTELRQIAKVYPGCYSGINDFFYLHKDILKKWKIESEFLQPLIRSSNIITSLNVKNTANNYVLSIPSISKMELKKQNKERVIDYIEWGAKQVTRKRQKTKAGIPWPKVETVKNRKYWYSIPEKNLTPTNLFMQYVSNDRFYCPYSINKLVSDRCFHRIFIKKSMDYKELCALLNSSIQMLFVMLLGRSNLGQGALKFEASDAKKITVFNPDNLGSSSKKKINEKLGKLGKREPLSIFEECGFNPSKPIREQEPKPLPDRAELDKIIFDEIGLTKEERKEVYWSVCELVKQRLEKAKSLKKG